MLSSMTGYGDATTTTSSGELSVHVRCLNSKSPNLYLQLPTRYASMDIDLRKMILDRLVRGKIDVTVTVEVNGGIANYRVNKGGFSKLYAQIKELTDEAIKPSEALTAILKLPEMILADDLPAGQEEQEALRKALSRAMQRVEQFRRTEGAAMKTDLHKRCTSINDAIELVIPHIDRRTTQLRDRMLSKLQDIAEVKVDKNRFEQEVIYYLERLDLNEEIERLRQHCRYFIASLEDDDPRKGRTLLFVSQEMGREINTLGAKANDHQIQHIVVGMKEDLDAIKEMLANVL